MGNIWLGKFWQTVQVKALVRKNLVNKLVSAYAIYGFHVSVNIGEENFVANSS